VHLTKKDGLEASDLNLRHNDGKILVPLQEYPFLDRCHADGTPLGYCTKDNTPSLYKGDARTWHTELTANIVDSKVQHHRANITGKTAFQPAGVFGGISPQG
jgi:hypothetical protein